MPYPDSLVTRDRCEETLWVMLSSGFSRVMYPEGTWERGCISKEDTHTFAEITGRRERERLFAEARAALESSPKLEMHLFRCLLRAL